MSQKNNTISICKAIAIILMVVGHADCPGFLLQFLYEFHMPLFFIAAGYFFNLKYLNNEKEFVIKRFKGLYIPFVKWGVIFLLLHNVFFYLNIINDKYGNGTPGGVAHPYTWHQLQQNIWTCVTQMGGYDVFLTGAFWFFRALLVASILYLVLFKLLSKLRFMRTAENKLREDVIGITICILMLLMAAWKTGEGLTFYGLPQGGYRELMGTFFFGIGFLIKRHQKVLNIHWWGCAICFITVALFSHFACASMPWTTTFQRFVSLPLPAIAGFLMTYYIAVRIDTHNNIVRRFLVYCGENTLPIYIFHIIAFKLMSLVKIAWYGMDFKQIGCHMVIHDHAHEDIFWILYAITGVGIPLLIHYLRQQFIQHRKLADVHKDIKNNI